MVERMHPAELIRGFLENMWRLPLIFKLFLLFGVGQACWRWLKRQLEEQVIAASAAWPIYKARVVWVKVSDERKEGRHGSVYWEGELTYSYTVPGHELEVGEFRKKFYDEVEADAWARALRGMPSVDVHVDPTDPKRLVWRETAIVLPPPMPVIGQTGDGSGAAGLARVILLAVCVAGAVISLIVQVSCLRGRPVITFEKNTLACGLLHVAMMGVIFGMIALERFQRHFREGKRPLFMRSFAGGPVTKALSAYTTIVFLYAWVRGAASDSPQGSESDLWGMMGFSAVWLSGYVICAAELWREMQGAEEAR